MCTWANLFCDFFLILFFELIAGVRWIENLNLILLRSFVTVFCDDFNMEMMTFVDVFIVINKFKKLGLKFVFFYDLTIFLIREIDFNSKNLKFEIFLIFFSKDFVEKSIWWFSLRKKFPLIINITLKKTNFSSFTKISFIFFLHSSLLIFIHYNFFSRQRQRSRFFSTMIVW